MRLLKNFFIVVLNLIGGLWIGFSRRPGFYDNYSQTKTKSGYYFFVALATLVTFGVIALLYVRLY